MNIINARLKRWLEKIGLKRIESFINGNSIATTCETSYSSKNEYKNFLLSYIENEINALHPIINIEEMRKWVLNTLLRLSELYESNSVILTNNDIILSANSKGNFRNDSEYDIVRIFEYYIPDSLLELISYLFLYEWDIESLTEINLGQYKIILSNEYNHSKSKIEGPIFFNEDTGDVWLEWSIIGNLPVGQNLYKFFRVLYESPNIAIPAWEVIERAWLAKSKSKEDWPYLWNELLSMGKKLGKDFIEVYIKRKANRFTLLNVKKAKETNLRPI